MVLYSPPTEDSVYKVKELHDTHAYLRVAVFYGRLGGGGGLLGYFLWGFYVSIQTLTIATFM